MKRYYLYCTVWRQQQFQKNEILQKGAAFGAHIFFDDQDIHTEPASTVVPAATVPYRDGDNPKE